MDMETQGLADAGPVGERLLEAQGPATGGSGLGRKLE